MPSYKTKAIVLKSYKLGEADKIIKLFSQKSGPIDAVAKGSRKIKSRFGGRLELFNFLDLEITTGRNLDIINQAEIIKSFKNIPLDFNKYLFCQVISEVVLKTHFTDTESSPLIFKLIYICFNEIDTADPDDIHSLEKIAAFFLAKFLKVTGYAPLIECCSICSRKMAIEAVKDCSASREEKAMFFSIKLGGIVCSNCAVEMEKMTSLNRAVSAAKFIYLYDLFNAGLKQFREINATNDVLDETYKLIGDYIKYHTESRINIFTYLDKIIV